MNNKDIFSTNLRHYMYLNGKTRKDICHDLGFSYYTFSDWVNGKKYPRMDKVEMLATYFGILKSDLIEDTRQKDKKVNEDLSLYGIKPIKTKKFRMIGEIACGEPIYCNEEYKTYVEASTEINADFCLTAKGNSMINARIYDGDIVFIKEQPMVEDGEIAAVIVDNEATLKRVYYYKNENKLVLAADNPAFAPLVYVNDELNNVKILGKAVAFMSFVK